MDRWVERWRDGGMAFDSNLRLVENRALVKNTPPRVEELNSASFLMAEAATVALLRHSHTHSKG